MNISPSTSLNLLDLPATEIFQDDLDAIGHIFGRTGPGPRLRCTVTVQARYERTKGFRDVFGRFLLRFEPHRQ